MVVMSEDLLKHDRLRLVRADELGETGMDEGQSLSKWLGSGRADISCGYHTKRRRQDINDPISCCGEARIDTQNHHRALGPCVLGEQGIRDVEIRGDMLAVIVLF